MRPPNGLMMFLAVLVGVVFSERRTLSPDQVVLALITSFGLTASSMALNDIFDREVDMVNNPSRPIPSGDVRLSTALYLTVLTGAAGLLSSAAASLNCFIIALTAYAAAVAYNWRLKKTGFAGNLAVSFTVVAPFLYGSTLSDGWVSGKIVVFTVLAFLANTGREVIKGMADVEGDARRDVKTLARLYGLDKAAMVGAGLYVAAVVLSPFPYLMGLTNVAYLYVVTAADSGFIYSCIRILSNPTPSEAVRQKNLTLVWMLLALASFIVGGLNQG